MYYPLSQITTDLYSNGGEFIYLTSKQPYSGYYWTNSKGQYFTGKTPQDIPTQELIKFSQERTSNLLPNSLATNYNVESYYNVYDANSLNYLNLKKPSQPGLLPTFSLTLPTQQDYQVGEFRRYFCKKVNEIIYLEINKDTYDKLVNKDSNILYQLYQPFNIPWQLTGNQSQIYKINKNIVELTMKQQKLPQFNKYLKEDYTKYYI